MTKLRTDDWTLAQVLCAMIRGYNDHLRQRVIAEKFGGDEAKFEAFVQEYFTNPDPRLREVELREVEVFNWLNAQFPPVEGPQGGQATISELDDSELFNVHLQQATLVGLSVEEFREQLRVRVPVEKTIDRPKGILHDMSDEACRARFLRRSSGL